jgi:succinate-acetate transporter protein
MTEQEFEEKYPQEKFTYVSKSEKKKDSLGQKEIEVFDIVSKKTGKTVISASRTTHTTVNWNYKTEFKKYLAWLTLPVVYFVFLLLLIPFKATTALGMVSLTLTVLGGTDFIKDNCQYLKIPLTKRRSDILMVCGIAVGFTAVIAGMVKKEFNFLENISYGALLIILLLTMIMSAKKDIQENKKSDTNFKEKVKK